MITRLYADNYCCLSAFTLTLDKMSVLMGPNGSGKTTVLKLLERLREFILGKETSVRLFPEECLTRWEARTVQTFELDLKLDQGLYTYRISISHAREQANNKVIEESLKCDGKLLFQMDEEHIQLYNDRHERGPVLQTDWHVSGISRIQERPDNRKLIGFRKALEMAFIVAPVPDNISAVAQSKEPVDMPRMDCYNFSDWLKNVLTAQPELMREAECQLKEGAIPGLIAFKALPSGDASILKCAIKTGNSKNDFRIDELSSGQLAMVVLETVAAVVNERRGTLLVDEPGNFLALSEIQPLLTRLQDGAMEDRFQVITTAHHPIAVNLLAAAHGIWLERDAAGPTRAFKVRVQDDVNTGEMGISIAELIERGWLSGLGINQTTTP